MPARSPARVAGLALILILFVSVGLVGCAFDDGEPWGRLTVQVQARGPLNLRTADGVTVELDHLALELGGLALYGADDPAASFDPADPPDGCTLCHGGHCHCGDALVPYAELAAQAAGGSAAPILTADGPSAAVELDDGPATVALDGCVQGCAMPRGAVTRAELRVVGLRVSGRTADGVGIEGLIPLELSFDTLLDLSFDRGQPVDQVLDLGFAVPGALFDGLDWPADGALDLSLAGPSIADNLATHAEWSPRTP